MEAPLGEHQQKMGDCPLQWLISDLQHPMRISTHEKHLSSRGKIDPPCHVKNGAWCIWGSPSAGEIFRMSAS